MRPWARRPVGDWADHAGATAVEFAMVLPAFILIMIGGFYLAGLAFAASSIQYAVQAAARCASVNTTVCPNSASTIAYASSRYLARGGGTPVFTSTTAPCGQLVSGTLNFAFDTGLARWSIPLNSTACFP